MVVELFAAFLVALSFFLQRITGFGSAVVATPILALLWAPHESIALMLIFQNLFGFWMIGKVWRRLAAKELRWFLVVFLPAVIVGAYLLPVMDSELVRRTMAAICALVLIQWLLIPSFRLPERLRSPAGGTAGLFSGLVQGTFGMGGPFFLLFYGSVEGRAERIRDSTIAVFFLANALRAPIAFSTAQFTPAVLRAAAYALLPFIAAVFLGARLTDKLDAAMFRYVAAGILFIAAAQLLFA
jgi:uncharacterized membrane protein YfcA